jgi:hypothetical protein
VAASAGLASDPVSAEALLARLTAEEKARWRQLSAELARWGTQPTEMPVVKTYAVVSAPPEPTHLLERGEPARKGPVVAPGGLAALKTGQADFGLPSDAPEPERRRRLADWITHPDNPLFARVMANRLWQHHFGAGLVETPSDFGFNGGQPSHPELLDWLAGELRQSGWKLKSLHRLMVTSASYRQQSRFRADPAGRDAGNRWLWRKSPLRLEAEALRDAVLQVAGQLNVQSGGPGYQDFKMFIRGATHYYPPADIDAPTHHRRSIYRVWVRSGRNPLLDVLDCPDPSTTTPRRAVTTTPLQALALLNNAFILRMADRFADRITAEAGAGVDDQIRLAYRLAYGRGPRTEEWPTVRQVVAQHGLPILCRAIFNSNEFLYVD